MRRLARSLSVQVALKSYKSMSNEVCTSTNSIHRSDSHGYSHQENPLRNRVAVRLSSECGSVSRT